MASSACEPRAGQRLGRYELLIRVANGGMGEVWAARFAGTHGFKKKVAIKTILSTTVDEPRFERMFIAEALLAARIHHANVVETIELAEHHGKLYHVMEWVDGETLGAIITQTNQHGGLPMSVAVNVIGQVCRGLHAAHELCDDEGKPLGLVHRDISPQNLIVSYTGTTKLLDFGVAKATLLSSDLTEAGELKGKLAYMSPEQLNARAIDRRSDIFSLGVLLYMLTTGRHPFKGESADATLRNISSLAPAAPPSAILPNYPSRLGWVLSKALRKRPEERFSTALELVVALEQAHPDWFASSFETRSRASCASCSLHGLQSAAPSCVAPRQSATNPGALVQRRWPSRRVATKRRQLRHGGALPDSSIRATCQEQTRRRSRHPAAVPSGCSPRRSAAWPSAGRAGAHCSAAQPHASRRWREPSRPQRCSRRRRGPRSSGWGSQSLPRRARTMQSQANEPVPRWRALL